MSSQQTELYPLSALQHLLYCERQCALIHLEQQWVENLYTAEGRELHRKVDDGRPEGRHDQRVIRSTPLRSEQLGLVGKADTIELTRDDQGVAVAGVPGRWRLFPVEHKRGKPKTWSRCDEVQLCAQALCLEEMLGASIPAGALFYGQRRRRTPVTFDDELRRLTREAAARLRQLFAERQTPPPVDDDRCLRCSLEPICLPKAPRRSALAYVDRTLAKLDRATA